MQNLGLRDKFPRHREYS